MWSPDHLPENQLGDYDYYRNWGKIEICISNKFFRWYYLHLGLRLSGAGPSLSFILAKETQPLPPDTWRKMALPAALTGRHS